MCGAERIRYYADRMSVIARDTVAADQLVYAWPYPINGAAIDVSCREDEIVVMCPSWMVGDKLGPGRHKWRSPDPSRPVTAFFVLTAPVQVGFDMVTSFMVPQTQQPVRVRAQGSLLVRAGDPGLLIAQFVGLPFDRVNDGLVRSVALSVERLLGRVLTRRVVLTGTPLAAADPSMLPSILEELTVYNPTAGAVIGVEFVRFNELNISTDDAGASSGASQVSQASWGNGQSQPGSQPAVEWGNGQRGHAITPSSADWSNHGVISGQIGGNSTEWKSDPAIAIDPTGQMPVGSPTTIPPPPMEPMLLPVGSRVLVASADGLLHSAMIRQVSQGYYEVEVGDTGETVWVPSTQIIPEG